MSGLVIEDFQPREGSVFMLNEDDLPPLELKLETVEALNASGGPKGMRPPFSLMFRCPDQRVLPQRLYRLEHPAMGEIAIFMVPIGRDQSGVQYQALFN